MLRSILSNWVGLVVVGVIAFFLTPFMIHRLGDFDYGIYVLAFSVVSYSDLLDAGIRSTLQRFAGRLRGLGDREGLNALFSTALLLMIGIGAAVIVIAALLSGALPSFFRLGGLGGRDFRWLIVLFGLNFGVGLPNFLLAAHVTGCERFDLYNLLQVIREVLRASLIVTVLLLGYKVLAVGGAILAVQVALAPVSWRAVRRADPEIRFSWGRASRAQARELLGFSVWMLMNNAGEFLRDTTDSIVIGRMLGATLITPFRVASRLIGYFRPIVVGTTGPLLPRTSSLDSHGRHEDVKRLYLQLTRLTALASLAVGSLLVLDGKLLIRLWVGERYVSSYPLLLWLTVGQVASLAQYATLQVLVGLGRHRAYGSWTLGEGLAVLALSIVWARHYGLAGVAMGTAIPLLAVKLTLQPWYTTRVLGMSLWEYFGKALARPLSACVIFLAAAGWLGGIPASGSLLYFLGTVAWQLALFVLLALAVGLDGSDRQLAREAAPRVARAARRLIQSAIVPKPQRGAASRP